MDKKGWESFHTYLFLIFCPFLGKTLLFWVPAFFFLYGCAGREGLETDLSGSGWDDKNVLQTQNKPFLQDNGLSMEQLYILTYNDDLLRRLDAWQKYPHFPEGYQGIDSRTGKKHVVLCSNVHRGPFQWEDIQSYGHLSRLSFPLEEEDPQAPLCVQELKIAAGKEARPVTVALQPFLSEIRINRLEVDFSKTAYAGAALTDIKIYLTNLNAELSLVGNDFTTCRRIINHRGLSPEDMAGFRHPQMVSQRIGNIEDGQIISPGISLWAYPNTCPEETMGSPFTRLVIEGKIHGRTYWYPININRSLDGTGKGIERNFIYKYNITIRRSGSADPDLPVNLGMVETFLTTAPWKEKEEYSVGY